MAALIGYLNYGHHAGTIHRLAHRNIDSHLATWSGHIHTYLNKDGTYEVWVNTETIIEIMKQYSELNEKYPDVRVTTK